MENTIQNSNDNNQKVNDLMEVPVDYANTLMAKLGLSAKYVKAVISWSHNANFVKLSEVDDNENETNVIFNVIPSVVDKADFNFNMIKLSVNKKTYILYIRSSMVDAAYSIGVGAGVGAGPAIALGTVTGQINGIDDLRLFLGSQGTKTSKPRLFKLIIITTTVVVALMLMALIFGLLFY